MLMCLVAGCVNGLVHALAGWGIVYIAHAALIAWVVAHGGEWGGLEVFATAYFIINQTIFAMIDTYCRLPIATCTMLPIPIMLTGIKNNIATGAPGLLGRGKAVAT